MTKDPYPFFDVNEDCETSAEHEIIDRIWKYFVGLRGGPLLPSCREIETMILWLGREIPEKTIMDGIGQALTDYRVKSIRPGFSLTSCRHEVNRLYLERTRSQVLTQITVSAASEVLPDGKTLISLLQTAIERNLCRIPVSSEVRGTVTRSFRRYLLQRWRDGRLSSLDTVDETLQHVDQRLTSILMDSLSTTELCRLKRESALIFSNYKTILKADEFERIVMSSVRERSRVFYGLRPLTVLDLQPLQREDHIS